MLNLVSDKNKEIKHGSMVCSIAEEKQSGNQKSLMLQERKSWKTGTRPSAAINHRF